MTRLRLYDLMISRMSEALGICRDRAVIGPIVNSSQARLINAPEAGDEGWWGTFAEVAFNVSRSAPYITLPRDVARLELVSVCDTPIPINNQFFEYLQFGNGRLPLQFKRDCISGVTGHTRNNAVFFTDPSISPLLLRVYGSALDNGKRVLFQGQDSNDVEVITQAGESRVKGVYVTIEQPFATTPLTFTTVTGVQKDLTADPVSIYQVDPSTGEETLLLVMSPSEETAWYRRYYFHNLPADCNRQNGPEGDVQVTAIVKLDMLPVKVDSDYCILQGDAGKEAIILEAQAMRMESIDSGSAQAMAHNFHRQAIRMLNGQLTHYLGTDEPALTYSIFGDAPLNRHRIGTLI
jgi:hypothetical protein